MPNNPEKQAELELCSKLLQKVIKIAERHPEDINIFIVSVIVGVVDKDEPDAHLEDGSPFNSLVAAAGTPTAILAMLASAFGTYPSIASIVEIAQAAAKATGALDDAALKMEEAIKNHVG